MNLKKISFVVFFLLFLLGGNIYAASFSGSKKKSTINIANEINILDKFNIGLSKVDSSSKYLNMKGNCYFFEANLDVDNKNKFIEYKGQKTLSLVSGLFEYKNGMHSLYKNNSCTIEFLNSSKKTIDSVEFDFDVAEFNYNLNVPSGLTKEDSTIGQFPIRWGKYTDYDDNYGLSFGVFEYSNEYEANYGITPHKLDFSSIDYKEMFKTKQSSQMLMFGNTTVEYESLSNVAGSNETFYYAGGMEEGNYSTFSTIRQGATVTLESILFYDAGYIVFYLSRGNNNLTMDTIASSKNSMHNELWSVFQSFSLNGKATGFELVEEEIEEEEIDDSCNSNSHCGKGEECSACGTCEPADELISLSQVNIRNFEMNPQWSSKAIPNSTYNKLLIRANPTMDFYDKNGKKISACDITKDSMQSLVLKGEVKSEKMYSGFINSRLSDNRAREKQCYFGFPDSTCSLLISPNDEKKIVGEIGDIIESIQFNTYNGDEHLFQLNENYTLKKVDFDFDIKTTTFTMQENSSKSIAIYFRNKYARNIFSKIKVLGNKNGALGYKNKKSNFIYPDFKPFTQNKFAYYSPSLGNINIGEDLQNLSMVALQKEAARESTEATALNFGGAVLETVAVGARVMKNKKGHSLRLLRKFFKNKPSSYTVKQTLRYVQNATIADKIAKNYKNVYKGYTVAKGAYGLKGSPAALKKDAETLGKMIGSKGNDATRTERVAELGIMGVDIAQLGVGMVTFLPNKIPVVNFIPAAMESGFARVSNIMKANLKYVAKSEKIERSKELIMPVYITVQAEDESGWITKGFITIGIAYQYLND